jgi:hypothetical protein
MPAAFDALKLSPDGKTFVVRDYSGKTRLLDAVSGRELRHFKGPEGAWGSTLTPDGRSLVIWSGDLKVRIWDVTTGRQSREYSLPQDLRIGQPISLPPGHESTSYHAALSPDGRLLAIGNNRHGQPLAKCFLVLKDLETGRDVRRIDSLPSDVHAVAFSPDGRILAWSGSQDWSIYFVESASGQVRRRLAGHRGQVIALSFSADGKRLISSSLDTTALVWDLSQRLAPRELPATELKSLWADLAGKDAGRADLAIRTLAASPTSALPFVRKHLRPVSPVDERQLTRLIADLDSDDFTMRRKAAANLEKLGESLLPAYRKALAGKPSLETRRRLEALLEKATMAWWDASPQRLRELRAVEALELAGTKEAREALKELADGATGARLTEQAKAALTRLTRRELPAKDPR